MARKYKKRFTDAHIHRDPEFRRLPWRLREAWRVLCGECDHLGVWVTDLESLALWVGEAVSLKDLRDAFKVEVLPCGKKLFLPSFVTFQCCDESELMNPKSSFHQKVAKELDALGLPCPKFKELTPTPPGGARHPTGTVVPIRRRIRKRTREEGGVGEGISNSADEAAEALAWARTQDLEEAAEYYRAQAKLKLKIQVPPFLKPSDYDVLGRVYDLPDMTIERLKRLLNAYVWMDNKWFDTTARNLPEFEKHINLVLAQAAPAEQGASS